MFFKKILDKNNYSSKKNDKRYHIFKNNSDLSSNGGCNYLLTVTLFLLGLVNLSSCEPSLHLAAEPPLPPSRSASSGPTSSVPVGGGTWTLRAIPHQTSISYSTYYEQIQNIKYTLESSIDHVMRKLELLETKISRMDTSSQLRLDKLTESVNSKEIKDELAMEQVIRKIDANYERINHKINFMDTRIDASINKIQTNIENGFNHIETRQAEIDSEVTDVNQSIEDLKLITIQMDEKNNGTQKSLLQYLQTIISESASRDQIDKLTGKIDKMEEKLNDTIYSSLSAQNDGTGQPGPDRSTDKIVQTLKTEVDRESHRIENKISNMYNDLWRRFVSLEMTAKSALTQGNSSRRLFQEDLRSFLQQYEKQRNFEPDSQENYIEIVMDAVMNTVQELARKVDSNFQVIITSQNLFMDNCHRLQMDEPQLESKISIVLEKILNTITNKTIRVDNRLVETMEMIKSHQTQVMRSLGHTTKMVVNLTEETNQEAKNIESALLELAERNMDVSMSIQELQEDVDMLTNITSFKLNNDIEDWFNKSWNENENEETIKYKTEGELSSKEDDQYPTTKSITIQQILPPEITINNTKPIKYADADDVIKIFTEDEKNNFYNNSNIDINNITEKQIGGGDKKLSIIIPNEYYEKIKTSNINDTNKSKFFKVGAIILNTEGAKTDENIKKPHKIDKKTLIDGYNNNKDTMSSTKTSLTKIHATNQQSIKISNEKKQPIQVNTSIAQKIENNITNQNNQETRAKETFSETETNPKLRNLTEAIKNIFDFHKNHKYKPNNLDDSRINNISRSRLLQLASQNNNLQRFVDHFNKKRKQNNGIKYQQIPEIANKQDSQPPNRNTSPSIDAEEKQEDFIMQNEPNINSVPENINSNNDFNPESTTLRQISDEFSNHNDDSSKLYDIKFANPEEEFSSLHGDQYPDYDY